jgi:hypothetical protein
MGNVTSVHYVYIKHSAPKGKYKLKRRHYAFPTRPALPKLQYSGWFTALNVSAQRLLTFVFEHSELIYTHFLPSILRMLTLCAIVRSVYTILYFRHK